jgi:hypothetical protein
MRRSAVLLLVLLLPACGGNKAPAQPVEQGRAPVPAHDAPPWLAPANAMALTRRAGLTPETHEFVFLHVHSHLDVFVNGTPTPVPAGIGIDVNDPAVKRFQAPDGTTGFGGISPPCAQPCISPLHTHFDDGVLHTEAKENQSNTLGEFFTEWAVRLDRNCVGGFCKPKAPISIYVDGDKFTGDARTIELQDKREIAIVIGRLPPEVPSTFPSG